MPILRIDGLDIGYDEYGSRRDPALVMIMGLGCQRTLWAPEFLRCIADRGFRVIRFDNRDVGESTAMHALGRPALLPMLIAGQLRLPYRPPYTLADMADDTVRLLDGLGAERAHVVGASMGGMIAQEVAIRAPRRVRSLCLWMTTMGDSPLPPPRPSVGLKLLRPLRTEPAAALEQHVGRLRAIAGGRYPFDEALARRLIAEGLGRENGQDAYLRHLAAVLCSPSRKKGLSALRTPTLVMHGTRDPLVPYSHGEALASTIPGARMVPLPGLGHEYPPPVWGELVDLIAGHALAADAADAADAAEESGSDAPPSRARVA